jgi:hypothetical protein
MMEEPDLKPPWEAFYKGPGYATVKQLKYIHDLGGEVQGASHKTWRMASVYIEDLEKKRKE